ncbi:MAG: DUF2059 domain-containing protein [Deltaproteobacteria bacterium]|nr:DUF2059 domain-containing protein [Deltaproteobacteria bacterium]
MRPNISSRLTVIIVVIAAVLTLVQFTSAQAQDPLITKVIRISGLRGQLQNMPTAFLMTIPADLFLDNRSRSDFNTRMKDEISPENLIEIFEETLSENIDNDKLNQVIKFYESNLGRKVGRIQNDALSTYSIRVVREGRKFATAIDDDRTRILERLIDSLRIYQTNLMYRKLIVRLIGSTGWSEQPKSEDTREAKLESVENSLGRDSDSLRQMALTCFANTYKSLNDSELVSLTEFYETQAGIWFQDRVSRAFEKVIIKIIGALDQGLRNLRPKDNRN